MHIHNAVLPRKSVVFTHEFLNWQVARCCECAEQHNRTIKDPLDTACSLFQRRIADISA